MDDALLTQLLEAAVRAPSIHNTQPWRFTVTGEVIDLFADRARALPVVDPTGRQLVLSCGAALECLCVAAAALGRDPQLRIGPDPARPDLLAEVDLSRERPPSEPDRALLAAIPRRHTSRAPFSRRPVADDVRERLAAEVAGTGAWASFPAGPDDVIVTSVLLSHANEAQRGDETYLAELADWRRENGVDGIPDAALAPTRGRHTSLSLRDFRARDEDDDSPAELPDEYAQLVVVGTAGDEQADWIVAGRALARLWLRATTLGLVASPMTQVLDSEPYRGWLRRGLRYLGHPQMLLRIGYGAAAPATPRRSVQDVLAGPPTPDHTTPAATAATATATAEERT